MTVPLWVVVIPVGLGMCAIWTAMVLFAYVRWVEKPLMRWVEKSRRTSGDGNGEDA